ncbi:predicted signal transduction protein containing a membrane domain, an EAL and a GGDEF domain [Serpentinimonas raichei]|uniref:Predicted signal transduction protein containing a membrane domain, an EAL and a GGDEF domain n=1 Tax=Serpentinimonas raichei TaxID=1458425 RepID=A0A060NGG4_9BURK|nr:EAL domain-containing protein [Serpentinimonas raichei]BAO80012.1 predicted signal transduction protein containing a membrane domain, an EAL and a GGDEF domain [Serpentinimonas raichei]
MKRLGKLFAHPPLVLRIVLLALLVLLVVQAAGFLAVRVAVQQQIATQLSNDLDVADRVWNKLLQQNAIRLREASGVLAADFGFRAAVASGDADTMVSALQNHSQRIGASMAALLDPQLNLVASTLEEPSKTAMLQAMVPGLSAELAQDPQAGRLAIAGSDVFQFVLVPVRAPLTVGWVLMGFPVGQVQLDDMQRLTGTHIILTVYQTVGGAANTVSSLGEFSSDIYARIRTQASEIRYQEGMWKARHLQPATHGGALRVTLLRSYDEVAQPFKNLQWLLGLIALAGLLLFALSSAWGVRFITRPLTHLTRVTRELRQGQFQTEVPGTERHDEVGELARGFDLMRTSIAQQREAILQLAYWDRLTELPNREQFRRSVHEAIGQAPPAGWELAVLTLNLNRFKHVNDVLGYGFGDELLKAVAQRLTQQMEATDGLVARLGGDEFALLLRGCGPAGAVQVAQRILQAFEAPLALGEQSVDMDASLGVACWPTHASQADELLGRAEIAMHAAKTTNEPVLVYAPRLDSASAETLSLLGDLRHALAHHELRLYLQPKLDLRSGAIVAAEALVRWQHPQRGLVPPVQFIPFAEQTGFVRQLTLWMFEQAALWLAAHASAQAPLRAAINLSTRDLLDPQFPARLTDLMQRHGVEASHFCLEITESAIMDDPQRAEHTLNQLAALGFKLSIDDFGTGYSSLAYLKRLPVQELKIDKSFVMGMSDDESDAKIVRSTIDLAHNLGLTVVAEGVESQAILQRLQAMGCDEAQGYHICRPMPASAFAEWAQQWAKPAA